MFDAPTGDLPLLLQLEEDEWHEIEIDLDSVEPSKTDKGWSCYVATINGDEDAEIPFWAMKEFYEFVSGLSKKTQTKTIAIRYRRTVISTKKGDRNTAEFKEA